jgi:hypothetical protein
MKKVAILLLLLAVIPFELEAFNTNGGSDALSYVAMPLAVSAVCDVRGVQTDRVGQLVTYMDQANVAPADFIDVFRYVPVALVLRTDGRPDFVAWVGDQVGRGVTGVDLASAMETQLRTYDNYVPVSTYSSRRPRNYARESYDYAYRQDYVPEVIHRHCERLLVDGDSLLDMPVAVSNVCDLGVPYDRVSGLAIELNLGRVGPLQFVELMRYAPVALSAGAGYYGQPDFVQYVRTQRTRGVYGDPLVQSVDRQLRVYNVAPQIDRSAPLYSNQPYYVPATVQNYVDPVSAAYVPQVVRTRVASNFAAGRAISSQPAPAIVVAPQVQRLLQGQNGSAVVANPGQARRELGRGNIAQREFPVAQAPVAPAIAAPAQIQNRGRASRIAQQPAIAGPAPVVANAPRQNGRGNKVQRVAPIAASPVAAAPPVAQPGQIQNRGKGRGRAPAIAAQPVAAAPAAVASTPRANGNGRGNGNGKRAERAVPAAAPTQAPMISSAPPPQARGNGKGRAVMAPVVQAQAPAAAAPAPVARGKGRGGPPPAAAAAPAAAPAGPPGQEKKKDKGKD